ncbi:response regulator [Nostoc parmelioides]|uniref:Response regulator n=1 Tax=Nostoc parmelioides FACHB-3921 TaxID=2692909 RepID=A0ABR8BPL3_9NOSO|nr:response regulator [Nostoc parmelioides]MBD2255480.1 response regulator [Nostoc parmelioides FACHB-3921]
MVRILLVNEQQYIRRYLQSLLDPDLDLEVIATTQKVKDAIKQVENFQPDIVLMDIDILDIDGVKATKTICQRCPHTKVLVLSSNDRDEYIHQSLDAGAMGYLLKDVSVEELREAIRFVCQGYSELESSLLEKTILKVPASALVSANVTDRTSHVKTLVEENPVKLSARKSDFKLFGKLITHPSLKKEGSSQSEQPHTKQIAWYQLLILLIIAVSCTVGIYVIRQVLRKPLPALNYLQQNSTLLGTEFTGKVKPAQTLKIAASDPSVVEKINIHIGDKVRLGQPLLVLKNPDGDREIQQLWQQRQSVLQQEQAALQQQQAAQQQVFIWEQKINESDRQETPLATKIADADLDVALNQTQADKLPLPQRQDSVERTKAIYERSQSRVRRFQQLYQQGAIAKDQLEQAEADLKVAKADYQVAQTAAVTAKNLEIAKQQKFQLQRQVSLKQQQSKQQELKAQLQNLRLEYQQATERLNLIRKQSTQLLQRQTPSVNTIVRSTSAGVVVQLPVKIGDQIFTGNPLLELAQLKYLNVEVLVNARLINALRRGQKATVQVGTGEAAQKFDGKIVTINPLPSEDMSHTVEIQFENPTDALLVGQMAAIRFLPE